LLPFTVTIDCETKFVPVTISENCAFPVVTPDGESEVTCGTGLAAPLIVNWRVRVVPPPGVGVETETIAVPAFWMSLAKTCAVSCPVVLNRVVSADPFHNTEEDGVKFEPVTIRLNAGWPASAFVGEIAWICGAG
jgi:hypothetical protein